MQVLKKANFIFKTICCISLCFFCLAPFAKEPVQVVTSMSILADLVKVVGQNHVNVYSLVGPNADMHVYQPAPSDIRRIQSANLLVVNGLGLEGWLRSWVKKHTDKEPAVLVASQNIPLLLQNEKDDHAHDGHDGHEHNSSFDPHAWQSIPNVMQYIDNIAAALIKIDPTHADDYQKNASAYKQQLMKLDKYLISRFSDLPLSQRKIIASHDAFKYFATRYGLTFITLQGVNTEAEPSAYIVASVIRQIKKAGIKTLFIENISDPRLVEQIGRETHATLGGRLYSDALSKPDEPASTYLNMMKYNSNEMLKALKNPQTLSPSKK